MTIDDSIFELPPDKHLTDLENGQFKRVQICIKMHPKDYRDMIRSMAFIGIRNRSTYIIQAVILHNQSLKREQDKK